MQKKIFCLNRQSIQDQIAAVPEKLKDATPNEIADYFEGSIKKQCDESTEFHKSVVPILTANLILNNLNMDLKRPWGQIKGNLTTKYDSSIESHFDWLKIIHAQHRAGMYVTCVE